MDSRLLIYLGLSIPGLKNQRDNKEDMLLLDVRSPEGFHGEQDHKSNYSANQAAK